MKTDGIECCNRRCVFWDDSMEFSCRADDDEVVERCSGFIPDWKTWAPTSENINRLPEPLRRYLHDLETRCDPAGDVAHLTLTKDQNKQLQAMTEEGGVRLPEWELKLYVSALEKWGFAFQLLMFAEEFSEAFKALHKMFRKYEMHTINMNVALPIIQEIVDLEIMSKQMLVAIWKHTSAATLGNILYEYDKLKEMKLDYLRFMLAKENKS